MFGNLGELAGMMKKYGEIKKNIEKMRSDMGNMEFEAFSGNDRVRVVVTGDFRVKHVEIAQSVTADPIALADYVQLATNAALDNAKGELQRKMQEATGGVDLPGLF